MEKSKKVNLTPRTLIENTLSHGNIMDTVRVTTSASKLRTKTRLENEHKRSKSMTKISTEENKVNTENPTHTPRALITNILDTKSVEKTIRPKTRLQVRTRKSETLQQDSESSQETQENTTKSEILFPNTHSITTPSYASEISNMKNLNRHKESLIVVPPRKKKRLSQLNVNQTIEPEIDEFAKKLYQGMSKKNNGSAFLSPQPTSHYQEHNRFKRAKRHSLDNMLLRNQAQTPQTDKFFAELMTKMKSMHEDSVNEGPMSLSAANTSSIKDRDTDAQSVSSTNNSGTSSVLSKHKFFTELINKMNESKTDHIDQQSYSNKVKDVLLSRNADGIDAAILHSTPIQLQQPSTKLQLRDQSSVIIKVEPPPESDRTQASFQINEIVDNLIDGGESSTVENYHSAKEEQGSSTSEYHDTLPSPFIRSHDKPYSPKIDVKTENAGTPPETANYSSSDDDDGKNSPTRMSAEDKPNSFFTMQTPKIDRNSGKKFDAILQKYFDKKSTNAQKKTHPVKHTTIDKPKLNLPCSSTQLRDILKHHTTLKIAPGAFEFMERASELYMQRTGEKLKILAKMDKKKIIQEKHAATLMKQRKYITNKTPLRILIEQHLPLEYRELLIPMALPGRKIFPTKSILSKDE